MANHSLPQTTSTYANFVTELNARFNDLAVGLDDVSTTATNVPTNSIRWKSSLGYWEKFNGTSWAALASSYNININGTVGATTPATGAFTTLSTTGIASLGASSTVNGLAIVTVSGTQTLTDKTLTTPVLSGTASGTIAGRLGYSSGAFSYGNGTVQRVVVNTDEAQTLSNKTLTAPRFASAGRIDDANGNELILFPATIASAVNEITISNAITAGKPTISATGGDSNITLNLVSKGTGTVQANGIDIVTVSSTQTLTNKTLTTPVISSIVNTGTLTLPTATTTLVGTNTTDTLSNKTLTAPRFASAGFIADANGNELILFPATVSTPVNQVTISNAAASGKPSISASGGDIDITLNLVSKGTGTVQVNGVDAVTISGTQTLTNKTLTTPVLSGTVSGTTAGRLGYSSGTLSYGNGTVQRVVVNTDEAQTLSNKTLTAPRFASDGFIADANGNELILFPATVSTPVNQVTISNAAASGKPSISASGGDIDITLNLVPKGTGTVQANGVDIVTVSGTQTLTNKTLTTPVISSIVNTGTLTLPTATTTLVGTNTTDTLSNKTLTAPRFASAGFIADATGNELILFPATVATPVNQVTIANAATSGKPTISATGDDTNITLNLVSKGTGTVQVNGVDAVTISGTQTLTNKTLTTPVLSATASGTTAGSIGYSSGTLSYGNGTVQRVVVNTDEAQTLSNKTFNSTGNVWNGGTIGVGYGGTGTASAPTQYGVIYASTASAYASTAAGTLGKIFAGNTSAAPSWQDFDLSIHAPSTTIKKEVKLATTTDLGASTYTSNTTLTGYSNTQSLACTTTAASTTITTTSTAGLKVGAVTSVATVQLAAGTSVASISNATTFVVNNRANIATTAITGTGATATATFAAQTYAPYAVGASIVISGTTPSTYSGTFTVTACTTTSVSWSSTETVTATVQGSIAFTIAAGTSITTAFAQTIAALSIDGITTVVNDRVLYKDSSSLGGLTATDSSKYNGIYTVTTVGSTTVPWVLTRAGDASTAAQLASSIVNVEDGTANGGKTFQTSFKSSHTLGTTAQYWFKLADVSASYLNATPTTAVGIDYAGEAKTIQLVAGAVTDLAINSMGVKTLTATSASTYTRASTLYIAGAPAASTNVTITTPYSMYIAAGNSYMAGTLTVGSTVNGLTLSSTAITAPGALTVSSTTTSALTLDSGSTGAVNLGTNANAKTITIGNTTGATSVNYNSGTGGHIQTLASAATNTIANVLLLDHQTSGTPAIGIGTGLAFRTETAAGNIEIGAVIEAVTTNVTSTTEAFDLVFKTMTGGAAATTALTIKANNDVIVAGDLTVSGGEIITAAGTASTLFNTTTTGNITIAGALSTGTVTVGATGSTGAVSLFPATGAQNISLGAATTGTVTIGGTSATAVQLPTGKTKVGQTFLIQGVAGSITLPAVAGTLSINLTSGSTSLGAVQYNGTTAAAGMFDGGTTTPTGTTRLNYGGYFYPTWINLTGSSDTTTAATHYFVETGSDGFVRPKTLANVQSEVVTTTVLGSGTANSTTFLRGDRTWATVTIPGAQTSGSTTAGYLAYNGTTKTAGQLDGGTVAPSNTTRLNYDGNLYVNTLTSTGTVSAAGATLTGTVSAAGATLTGTLTVSGSAPIINLVESDQTLPAGRRRIVADGNTFQLRRNTAAGGDFSTEVVDINSDASGNFTASGSVTALSDRKLKKDIEVIPNALEKVGQLSGYTYTRIDSGERQTGLIAQEVEAVLPEAVVQGETLSLAYGNLVGLLVEAIKELKQEVEELKAKLQ